MTMPEIKLTETEVIERRDHHTVRYPNLNTVLMVEDFLKKNRATPMRLSELKRNLPRKVMHQTLRIILEYLFRSGKIIYGPRGVQWIYSEPDHLKRMMENSLEV